METTPEALADLTARLLPGLQSALLPGLQEALKDALQGAKPASRPVEGDGGPPAGDVEESELDGASDAGYDIPVNAPGNPFQRHPSAPADPCVPLGFPDDRYRTVEQGGDERVKHEARVLWAVGSYFFDGLSRLQDLVLEDGGDERYLAIVEYLEQVLDIVNLRADLLCASTELHGQSGAIKATHLAFERAVGWSHNVYSPVIVEAIQRFKEDQLRGNKSGGSNSSADGASGGGSGGGSGGAGGKPKAEPKAEPKPGTPKPFRPTGGGGGKGGGGKPRGDGAGAGGATTSK